MLKPLNLLAFPKICLGRIWRSEILVHQVLRYHSNHFLAGRFFRITTFSMKKCNFLEVSYTFLDHFRVRYWSWLLFLCTLFKGSRKIKRSKMEDPRGPSFEYMVQFLWHMTSLSHVADLKGNIIRRNICPLSFVVIALIFSELKIHPFPVPEDQKLSAWLWLCRPMFCGFLF